MGERDCRSGRIPWPMRRGGVTGMLVASRFNHEGYDQFSPPHTLGVAEFRFRLATARARGFARDRWQNQLSGALFGRQAVVVLGVQLIGTMRRVPPAAAPETRLCAVRMISLLVCMFVGRREAEPFRQKGKNCRGAWPERLHDVRCPGRGRRVHMGVALWDSHAMPASALQKLDACARIRVV